MQIKKRVLLTTTMKLIQPAVVHLLVLLLLPFVCHSFRCSYDEQVETVLCENFIILNSSSLNPTGPIRRLVLRPAKERRNSFNDELIGFFQKIKDFYTDNFDVELENFVDFDIGFNPFTLTDKRGALLRIDNSVFEFKTNGLPIFNCTYSLASTQQKLFAEFDYVSLEINTIYRERLCPAVFGDALIVDLVINGIDYRENPFTFSQFVSRPPAGLFTPKIRRLELLRASLLELDQDILNQDLFRDTVEIFYEADNELVEIDSETIGQLRALRRFELSLNNWNTFVKTSNGNWYSKLNVNRIDGFVFYLIGQRK